MSIRPNTVHGEVEIEDRGHDVVLKANGVDFFWLNPKQARALGGALSSLAEGNRDGADAMNDSRDTVDTPTNHVTLAALRVRRDEARAEESRVLLAGEPDADVPAIVVDAYDTAIVLFEEMDQRLRELSEKWRKDADSAESVGQSADLEAVLQEFEGKPREETGSHDD